MALPCSDVIIPDLPRGLLDTTGQRGLSQEPGFTLTLFLSSSSLCLDPGCCRWLLTAAVCPKWSNRGCRCTTRLTSV